MRSKECSQHWRYGSEVAFLSRAQNRLTKQDLSNSIGPGPSPYPCSARLNLVFYIFNVVKCAAQNVENAASHVEGGEGDIDNLRSDVEDLYCRFHYLSIPRRSLRLHRFYQLHRFNMRRLLLGLPLRPSQVSLIRFSTTTDSETALLEFMESMDGLATAAPNSGTRKRLWHFIC